MNANDPYWTNERLAKLELDLRGFLSGGLPRDAELAEYAESYHFDTVALIRLFHMRWFPDASVFPQLKDLNLRLWLETEAVKFGTIGQQAIFGLGQLPENELLSLARSELFKSIETAVGRWTPLKYNSVKHVGECHALVDFRSLAIHAPMCGEGGMNVSEMNRFKSLQVMASITSTHEWLMRQDLAKPVITVHEHEARCTGCHASKKAYSARVAIPWAGRTLVREYNLSIS